MSSTGMDLLDPNVLKLLHRAGVEQTVFVSVLNTSNSIVNFELIKDNIINTEVEKKAIGPNYLYSTPVSLFSGGAVSIKTIHPGLEAQLKIPEIISTDAISVSDAHTSLSIKLIDINKPATAIIYSEKGRLAFDSKYLVLENDEEVSIEVDRVSEGDDEIIISIESLKIVKRISAIQTIDTNTINPQETLLELYIRLKQKNKALLTS